MIIERKTMQNNSLKYLPHIAIAFLAAALCHYDDYCGSRDFLCVEEYPYGFYTMLRFAVCGYFGLTAYKFYRLGNMPAKFIICCLFTILYNPVIKVSFELKQWLIINAFSILLIIFIEKLYIPLIKSDIAKIILSIIFVGIISFLIY